MFLIAATFKNAYRVTIVIDALDESRQKDRRILIKLLYNFYNKSSRLTLESSCFKFLITNHSYHDVQDDFQRTESNLLMIRLHEELKNDKIHKEIDLVMLDKVVILAQKNQLNESIIKKLKQKLLKIKHQTYL